MNFLLGRNKVAARKCRQRRVHPSSLSLVSSNSPSYRRILQHNLASTSTGYALLNEDDFEDDHYDENYYADYVSDGKAEVKFCFMV